MRTIRITAGVGLGVAALVASSLGVPAGAAPAGTGSPVGQRQAQAEEGAGEFVVAFQGQPDAAVAAVADAGGRVLDVNEELGLALVSTDDTGFAVAAESTGPVTAVARNHAVGSAAPGQSHRFAEERPSAGERADSARPRRPHQGRGGRTEPLADLQWNLDAIDAPSAHRRATGEGVTVGIIDTGVDASHPDIAPNFDAARSRNFTMDIPEVDGPCEVATCIDPPDVDPFGHGTHVAGIVAAARNGIGTSGVAPDATLVNLRAAQDSGYFFLYETVAALTYAGDLGLDVVNMSFYTDPWLYNCDSADDYVSGPVTEDELADQAFTRQTVSAALDYAHARGVTLAGSAGNAHTDLAAPTRSDATSPDYPPGSEVERVVTSDCLTLPGEGPHVITVSATGPSGTKADYSNYGEDVIDVAAPGGFQRDLFGTPQFNQFANRVLAPYPLDVAIAEELVDENGQPVDGRAYRSCDRRGENCGIYAYLQGTSMASPHVAGVAALVVEEHGEGSRRRGYSLDPDVVRARIEQSATDTACPAGGVEDYTDEGRPVDWNAPCEGDTDDNGLYGEGIVNAAAALRGR